MIADGLQAVEGIALMSLYAPGHEGETIAGMVCSADAEALAGCEVVVEVTRPDVVMDNLRRWKAHGCNVVVGTSGFDAARLEELGSLWGSGPPNCLVVANFSVGAVLLMRFAAEAAGHFDAAEIIELHHAAKLDAPSGTALATAAAMGSDVPIHSVRLPGLVAHQEVILGSEGQTLTIRHDTTDRRSFLPGVVASIRVVGTLPGVTVGLDQVL